MKQQTGYRSKFGDISVYSKELGGGSQSIVDLHILTGIPRIQYLDLKDNLVAVKNYHPDKFGYIQGGAIKEVDILSRLIGCPHLIQLLDVDIVIINQKIMLRIMLPHYTSDLTAFIKRFSFLEKLKYYKVIIDQMLNALLQLSIKGIIHRDIKPDNILVDYEYDANGNLLLKEPNFYLSDFGLSVQLPCERKFRSIKLSYESGTPLYFAPEILSERRNYDEKIDIWALGVTLVTYFLIDEFTYPSEKSYNSADGFGPDAIIYELLDNLVEDHSFQSFNNLSFHDHIDLKKVFTRNGRLDYYINIPENIIKLITSMLEINPKDRLNIMSVFTQITKCHGSDKELKLGSTMVNITSYYDILHKMLVISKDLKLETRTFISALNLLNKLIHTYDVYDPELFLAGASCLYITSKISDEESISPEEYINLFDNKFTLKQFRQTEIFTLQISNYMVSSCYVDEFIYEVENITRRASLKLRLPGINDYNRLFYTMINFTYSLLDKMYRKIEEDAVFVGQLTNSEMIEYLNKVNT